MDNDRYFYYTTIYKVQAYATQFVTNYNFYKFNDDLGNTVYSFQIPKIYAKDFFNKINKLNKIKFNEE